MLATVLGHTLQLEKLSSFEPVVQDSLNVDKIVLLHTSNKLGKQQTSYSIETMG